MVLEHGFRIVQRWSGYTGERYGERSELMMQCGAQDVTTLFCP
jgi:hypothetical protein